MSITKIRERKDGGFSECTSPEELVGRGRCVHILSSDKNKNEMELRRVQRGLYEVTVNDSKMTIKSQKKTIVDFFSSMPEIDDEKRSRIISYLEEE